MKILLIDDDPVVLETVSLMLSADGHAVLTAPNAREAFAQLEDGQIIDLVLTDLNMPELSGCEFVRRVRLRWPGLRVGIITGSPDELPAGDLALDVLLTKPVDLVRLQQAIQQLGAAS